jgi:hypothetical protein
MVGCGLCLNALLGFAPTTSLWVAPPAGTLLSILSSPVVESPKVSAKLFPAAPIHERSVARPFRRAGISAGAPLFAPPGRCILTRNSLIASTAA